jgi:tellurite resistance protein TerC
MLVADVDAARGAQLDVPPWGWIAFLAFLAALLLVDLLVLHRKAEVISLRRAAIESAAWIAIGLAFGLFIAHVYGSDAAGQYYAGYLIEKSLSVDNVFVWALILGYFAVPRKYQHRVLFWGIFAALVLRAIFIFGGVALLDRLDWLMYLFGGFLVFTAVRLLVSDPGEIDPSRSRILNLARRIVPSTERYDGQKLFTREMGRRVATPLFFVLVVIEVSDVLFAVDSVPAILAVTRDQFIVFTSNALAIVGLRSLYFLLADLEGRFRFLQPALAVILAFVGVKMLLAKGLPAAWVSSSTPTWLSGVHIPTAWSLLVIAVILTGGIVASVLWPGTPAPESLHHEHQPDDATGRDSAARH